MEKLSNEWLAAKLLDLAKAVDKLNERVILLEQDKVSYTDAFRIQHSYYLPEEVTALSVDMAEIIEDINKFAEEKIDGK